MYKKIVYITSIIFFVASCNSFDSVKRGLTGEKRQSVDEFLVQKKDPLILPPDYESLPSPDERISAAETVSNFEKSLEITTEDSSSTSTSTESFILKKIQSK